VRTEVAAAHVSHSARAIMAEGVRWRHQTVVWPWPEGPATEAAREEPRIWKEGVPGRDAVYTRGPRQHRAQAHQHRRRRFR